MISYRQAILTKFVGPTNHRGSRVIVKAQAGRMIIEWDHALDPAQNHERAANIFACKWGWAQPTTFGKRYVGGAVPDGTGYCFVEADRAGEVLKVHSPTGKEYRYDRHVDD